MTGRIVVHGYILSQNPRLNPDGNLLHSKLDGSARGLAARGFAVTYDARMRMRLSALLLSMPLAASAASSRSAVTFNVDVLSILQKGVRSAIAPEKRAPARS